jgi:hypothetical protein
MSFRCRKRFQKKTNRHPTENLQNISSDLSLENKEFHTLTKTSLKNFYFVCCTQCFYYLHLMVTLWTSDLFFIFSSIALKFFAWPSTLLQFRNLLGLLGHLISLSQSHYLRTGLHKHRIKAHTDIHASSGIRAQDSRFRSNENSLCPSLHRHRDWHKND